MKYSKMKETIKEFFYSILNKIKSEEKTIRVKVYIVVLIIAIGVSVFNLIKPMSKKELINQLEMALLKGKENWAEKNIKIDGVKADDDELKPLIDYFLLNDEDVERVVDHDHCHRQCQIYRHITTRGYLFHGCHNVFSLYLFGLICNLCENGIDNFRDLLFKNNDQPYQYHND